MRKNEALTLARRSIESGNKPRVHPNGFIQLDLDDSGEKRMHVWRNDLPRQKVYTPVHNHRFNFASVTVTGALTNMTFEFGNVEQGSPHRLWVVKYDIESEETKLVSTPTLIGLMAADITIVKPGEGYDFAAGEFHETGFVHNTVTVIEKSESIPGIDTTVLVPEDMEPDNTFTRAVPNTINLQRKIFEALA